MSITIDNLTNIMHWEHDDVSYEYKIDSTGRAFAYMSGDYIFIEIYNEGCSSHRVISVKGGYKFSRFFCSSPLSVICEQITGTSDKYGRNDWKFEFDSLLLEWKLISVVQ